MFNLCAGRFRRAIEVLRKPATRSVFGRGMSKKCKLDAALTGSSRLCNSRDNITVGKVKEKNIREADFEYLVKPEKSPADKKEYSAIRLRNGLTALLITDYPVVELDGKKSVSGNTTEDSSGSESDSENSIASSYTSNDSDTEAGGAKAGKEGEEKIAACALSVGVGSFSDPEDIPGLAHFLEHMVFMGSEKYPTENEFDAFIKRKGGSDNASTECEFTTFYFECQEEHLLKGMDIFCQFFISPLMKFEAIARERQAIESEFQMALPSDGYRRDQLLCSLADSTNPAHKFMWGNLETLRDNVTDQHLHNSVHEFRKRHYSGHRMALAVQARISQDVLAQWVHTCFSHVQNNQLSPTQHPALAHPFQPQLFQKIYYVEPVNDICEVELTWALPPVLHLYKKKPLEYISWLLGHEGKGGLLSYLRKRVWALGIVAAEGDDCGSNSLYSLFSVKIELSEEGYKHLPDTVAATFSYIKLLQDTGPVERIYNEMKSISDMNFKYYDEVSPIENVESLVENMHLYPPEHYLTGSELYFQYDPEEMKRFLDSLRPDNVNIMVSSKRVKNERDLNQTEKWFGTKYTSTEIPEQWIESWRDVDGLMPEFHLPEPNLFIPDDFSILPVDEVHAKLKYPRKTISTDMMELWFKEDIKFNLPQAYMYFYFISPLHMRTPLDRAMVDVYTVALGQLLTEDVYPAVMAEMGYSFTVSERGLVLSLYGFNQNLHLLLDKIVDGILNFKENLTPDMFEAVKKVQHRNYINQNLKAGVLAGELRMLSTLKIYWPIVEKLKVLPDISYNGILEFSERYFEQIYIQGLVQGNISEVRATEIAEGLVRKLDGKPLPGSQMPRMRVCKLDKGEKCIRAGSFNSRDVNCVTTMYFQHGPGKIREYCIIEILQMLLEEPLFDTLRTQEQLGYDVSCTLRDTYGILGFSITVVSQADKVTVEHVEERINNFLKTSLDHLSNMSKTDFDEVVTSVIKLKQYSDVHLKEEVQRNWAEIKNSEFVFDRLEREVEYLSKITLHQVHNFLSEQLSDKGKKLLVQVVSEQQPCSQPSSDSPPPEDESTPTSIELVCTPNKPSHLFITDTCSFKNNLTVYPINKIDY